MKNQNIAAVAAGFIFGVGLVVSGMTQPHKVFGFLDVFGDWDPTLIFVMLGAIAVHFISYRVVRKKDRPRYSPDWHVPTKTEITKPLIIGAMLFGMGWALAGYCPGPALTSLASFHKEPFIFVISMLVGMGIFKVLDKKIKFNR